MAILVTGATGNVGSEVAAQLLAMGHDVVLGTRDGTAPAGTPARAVQVDFQKGNSLTEPFDAIFLMRPPQIVDADLFTRFLAPLSRSTPVVFLSVQGADTDAWLPHARIEKRIAEMGFTHVFVRPSYFMDNLLTTLWPELEESHRITLPAGGLTLDWISARDVAAVCVAALTGGVPQGAITACSGVQTGFAQVCATINRVTGSAVTYRNASLAGYILHSRRQGMAWAFIGVMLLLHYLPRFRRQTRTDGRATARVLGREVETLEQFAARHRARFASLA